METVKAPKKYNKFIIGAVGGIIIPIITSFVFHLVMSPKNLSYGDFVNQSMWLGLASPILSLCVIPNLLFFFIFIWTERYYSARGVIFSTLIYAIVVYSIKFFA